MKIIYYVLLLNIVTIEIKAENWFSRFFDKHKEKCALGAFIIGSGYILSRIIKTKKNPPKSQKTKDIILKPEILPYGIKQLSSKFPTSWSNKIAGALYNSITCSDKISEIDKRPSGNLPVSWIILLVMSFAPPRNNS